MVLMRVRNIPDEKERLLNVIRHMGADVLKNYFLSRDGMYAGRPKLRNTITPNRKTYRDR